MVTMFFLIIWLALTQLWMNLSDYGRFLLAVREQMMADINVFAQFGTLPVLQIPSLTITLLGQFFFVIPWLFLWIMDLGYLYYIRGTIRGETLGYRSIFEGFNYIPRGIIIRILQVLLIGIGSVFLLVPGILFFCGFSQVHLLLLDHPDKGVFWIFRESWRIMRGRKREYFALVLSFIGWFLLMEIPYLSIAARLWVLPYFTAAKVYYYDKLTGRTHAPETEWKRPGMF